MPQAQQGESATSIVQKLGTTPEAFLKANPGWAAKGGKNDYLGLTGDIQVGQEYSVPGATPTATDPNAGVGIQTADAEAEKKKFSMEVPEDPSSDLLKEYTSPEKIKKMLDEANEAVDKSLQPTEQEGKLKTELADIRQKADSLKAGVRDYEQKLEGQGISASAIEGRSWDIERNVNDNLEVLALQEKNLLTRLGLEQEARKIEQTRAENRYAAVKETIELFGKMQDRVNKEKTDLLVQTEKLEDNARQSLNTVLTQFDGLSYYDLNDEAQKQLADVAKKAGIPIDLVIKGMEVVKNQKALAQIQKNQNEAKKNLYTSGGLTVPKGTIAQGQQTLNASRGDDGYANSAQYLDMLEGWRNDKGLDADFFKNYPPKLYLNPNDASIPRYIRDMLKKPSESDDSLF